MVFTVFDPFPNYSLQYNNKLNDIGFAVMEKPNVLLMRPASHGPASCTVLLIAVSGGKCKIQKAIKWSSIRNASVERLFSSTVHLMAELV